MSDVLLFLEDPGAINFLQFLPDALGKEDLTVCVVTAGFATQYYKQFAQDTVEAESKSSLLNILLHQKPKIIIVGTSENKKSLALYLLELATQYAIFSLAAIDMKVNSDKRFKGETDDVFAYKPNALAVPDDDCKKEYINLGFSAENIFVTGHPLYEHVLKSVDTFKEQDKTELRKNLFPLAQAHDVVVVFIAEGVDQLEPDASYKNEYYSLQGRGGTEFRTHIVLEELIDALHNLDEKIHLVLRLHPKNKQNEFADYLDEVQQVSQQEDSLSLVYAADIVVGMASMLLLEACLLGKKTLSILPDSSEKTWLPNTENGWTPVVNTREQLQLVLSELESSGCYQNDSILDNIIIHAESNFLQLVLAILLKQESDND